MPSASAFQHFTAPDDGEGPRTMVRSPGQPLTWNRSTWPVIAWNKLAAQYGVAKFL
jgi:hypothetical protein